MKRNPNILILLVVFLLTQACNSPGYRTLYDNQSVKTVAFDCERHVDQISSEIVEISSEDIRNCLLYNKDKVVWLLFLYYDCMGGVTEELELHSLFSDKVDLYIISMNYDVKKIKKEEEKIGKPIYFIERIDKRMRKNRDMFISDIFGVELGKDYTRPTSIFIHNREIINVGYHIDIEFIKQVISVANI